MSMHEEYLSQVKFAFAPTRWANAIWHTSPAAAPTSAGLAAADSSAVARCSTASRAAVTRSSASRSALSNASEARSATSSTSTRSSSS